MISQIIRMLTEKCRNQEEIIADLELREQEHQELEAESELLRQQVNATRYNVLKVDLLLLLLIHITKLKQIELDELLSLNNVKIYIYEVQFWQMILQPWELKEMIYILEGWGILLRRQISLYTCTNLRRYLWWNLCTLYVLTCHVSYFRQLRSLLLCMSDIFWVLINSVVCWFSLYVIKSLSQFNLCLMYKRVFSAKWQNEKI